jgi:hypothetical protein
MVPDHLHVWVGRGDPVHGGSEHVFARAQAIDPVTVVVATAQHPVHHIDPSQTLGQGVPEEPARPHDRDAVGQDQIAGEHVGPERQVPPHVYQLRRVDHTDLEPASADDALVDSVEHLVHREGVDGDPEDLLLAAPRGRGAHSGIARSCHRAARAAGHAWSNQPKW